MEVICSNKLCRKFFEWKYGRRRFLQSENHYCSCSCRNIGRGRFSKELTCANKLCKKLFIFKESESNFKKRELHYCCRGCQSVTHGKTGTPEHKIWERAKRRAKKDGTIFNLTIHDIPNIPTHCSILGIQIKANDKAGPLDTSPSIDRIVPELGYVKENIRIVSNRANRLRNDSTLEELRLLVKDAENLKC